MHCLVETKVKDLHEFILFNEWVWNKEVNRATIVIVSFFI